MFGGHYSHRKFIHRISLEQFRQIVDPTSGKDTLHNTVGIIFQDVDNSSDENLTQNSEQNPHRKNNESITENEEISNDTSHIDENSSIERVIFLAIYRSMTRILGIRRHLFQTQVKSHPNL